MSAVHEGEVQLVIKQTRNTKQGMCSAAYSDNAGLCFHDGLGYLQSFIIEVTRKINKILIKAPDSL